MQAAALREIARRRKNFSEEERRWCIKELTGPLPAFNPLAAPESADDEVLAAVLLRAWEESIRCDCPQVGRRVVYSTRIFRVPTPCWAMESRLARL